MSEQPPTSYHLRIGTPGDVPAMARLASEYGEDARTVAVGCERVLRERFGFTVVALQRTGGSERFVGYMNVPLLRPHLGKRVRCGGVPFSHLLANEESRLIANEAEVGQGNGGSGHDLLVSHYYQDVSLPRKAAERVMTLLVSGFVDRFVGNRIRSLLYEVRGMDFARQAEHGGYAIIETYDDWHERSGKSEAQRAILIESDRDRVLRSQNFHLARLLDYHAPNLYLPPAAREVVRCAYLGLSDAQIVAELSLTPASLNSRWTRIFDIVETKMPSLFAAGHGARARDRQPLMAYLRNHPEEMWPYEPPRTA